MSGDEARIADSLRERVEDWLHDGRWPEPYDLSHAIVASDWLAQHVAAAKAEALREAAASVERAVEKVPSPTADPTHASEYWRGYRTAASEAAGALTDLATRVESEAGR